MATGGVRQHQSVVILTNYQYNEGDILGRGSFGAVYEGRRLTDYKTVAIKKVEFPPDKKQQSVVKRELDLMNAREHQNVMGYIEAAVDGSFLYIIMEKCNGSLQDLLQDHGGKFQNSDNIQGSVSQLAAGYEALFHAKILHRDIKPQNCLYTISTRQTVTLKLADLGCGRILANSYANTAAGTIKYMAPEVFLLLQDEDSDLHYDARADLWSLGLVFHLIASGTLPKTSSQPIKLDPKLSNQLKEVVSPILKPHHERMQPEELFFHSYTRSGTGIPVDLSKEKRVQDEPLAEERKKSKRKEDEKAKNIFIENNWKNGKYKLQRIDCQSLVWCLQYDDKKIVSGHSDNIIRIWDRATLRCTQVLKGHKSSIRCLQFDNQVIVSGSFDNTIRVWDVHSGELLNTLNHHSGAICDVRFRDGILVTCSQDKTIAVWDMIDPKNIYLRRSLTGHTYSANAIDFDKKYIVTDSGDKTIKVWNANSYKLIRTLNGHAGGIFCLQYRNPLVVSGSMDKTIRLWDIERGLCLRVLNGHKSYVWSISVDTNRIVSGDVEGKIKVWDLKSALDPKSLNDTLCSQTFAEHKGGVTGLQLEECQIISCSNDGTILIWDFTEPKK